MHEQIIQAAIVNHERTHVLVDKEGELPELKSKEGHITAEDTLLELGRTVLKNVSYVSPDYGYGREGKMFYQTKPVPEAAQPVEPYEWGVCPESVELQ